MRDIGGKIYDTSSKSEDTATTENKKTEEKKSVSLDSLNFG